EIVERVRSKLRMSARPAVKRAAEIVERTFSRSELTNRHVHIEPDQRALRIKIDTAPPCLSGSATSIENLRRNGRVEQRTPRAADVLRHLSSIRRHLIAILLGSQKSAAIR